MAKVATRISPFSISKQCLGLLVLINLFLATSTAHVKAGNTADSLVTLLAKTSEDTTRLRLLNQLGKFHRKTEPEKAEQYARRARELAHRTGNKAREAEAIYLHGAINLGRGNYERAIILYAEAGKIYEAIGNQEGFGLTIENTGQCWYFSGNLDSAEYYLFKVLRIWEETRNKPKQADVCRRLGTISDYRGKLAEAKAAYQKAINIYTGLGNQELELSRCYSNLASLFGRRGEYSIALKYMNTADSLLQGLEGKAIQKSRSAIINNIGNVYQEQGNAPKAIQFYLKALELVRGIKDKRIASTYLFNLGVLHYRLGNVEEAYKYLNEALEIVTQKGMKGPIAGTKRAIGRLQIMEGKYDESLQNLKEALAIILEVGDKQETMEITSAIGENFMGQEQYDSAEYWFLKARILSRENQNGNQTAQVNLFLGTLYNKQGKSDLALKASLESFNWTQKNNYLDLGYLAAGLLAEIYAKRKNYKQALHYNQFFKEKGDTILNASNIKAVTRLEYQYQAEKDQQAEQLKREQDAALFKAELKKEKTRRNILLIAIGIVVLLAVLFYWNYRNKRKANKKLVQSNLLINQQKLEISWLNQNLEQEVAKRTQELETQNEQLSRYAFLNAHEVRGPLARILGLLEINKIGAFKTEAEKTEMIHNIKRSAEEIETLIESINNQITNKHTANQ